jgi:hypothetical protein
MIMHDTSTDMLTLGVQCDLHHRVWKAEFEQKWKTMWEELDNFVNRLGASPDKEARRMRLTSVQNESTLKKEKFESGLHRSIQQSWVGNCSRAMEDWLEKVQKTAGEEVKGDGKEEEAKGDVKN